MRSTIAPFSSFSCRAVAVAAGAAMSVAVVAAEPMGPTPPAQPHAATTTAPTTQVLRKTPLAAVIVHAAAMVAGNPQLVRESYFCAEPEQETIPESYTKICSAVARLRTVANARFGANGFEALGFGTMFSEEVERLKQARQIVDQDHAVVLVPLPGTPAGKDAPTHSTLHLVRVKGEWKIDVAATYGKDPRRMATRIAAQADAYEALADDIAAGKFNSAFDARVAGRDKVAEAKRLADEQFRAATRAAATQPADAPATQP